MEAEDEFLNSEDDDEVEVEYESLGEGDDGDRYPYIVPQTGVQGQEQIIEDSEFHPTAEDIALARSLLPLPPELAIQILDFAGYWALSRVTRREPDAAHFKHSNMRFLQSSPIQGGELHPLRRLIITTDSKDQGWSSYPQFHGTRDGSWTWFELTLDDGLTGEEIARVEVVRNIHAGANFERYRAVIEDDRILKQAKKGDRLSVWVRAAYPGWVNRVRLAQIEAWSAH